MKVGGIGGAQGAGPARRKERKGGSASDFASHLVDSVDVASATGAVEAPAVAGVDAMLSLQEVSPDAGGRGRDLARRYGEDLLARLDRLRLDLLAGAIPKDELARLAHAIRAQRRRTDDPHLNGILEEIELRAEVEIAKFSRTTP